MSIPMLDPTRIAILSVALGFLASPAISQQPAASHPPAVQSGAGSGFTQPDAIDLDDHRGWQSMFDGKNLNAWDGDKTFWRVEDGAIVAESTCEKPTGTIYLIWQGGEPADFGRAALPLAASRKAGTQCPLISKSSISKISVAPPGITGGCPLSP
jgi:Domain of Unknown Function (DUF1080)